MICLFSAYAGIFSSKCDKIGDIRIPNADEYGAWANYWKPGGLTTNEGLEVQTTIDSNGYIDPKSGKYQTR